MIVFDPNRPDFAPYGLTCERWTPRRMRRPDRHHEVELNLLRAGALHYLMGGRKVTVAAGRLTAFWAAVPHQIVGSRGHSEYYVVTVPLAWFLQADLPAGSREAILQGRVVSAPANRHAAADWALCQRWEDDLRERPAVDCRALWLELQARLWRLAEEWAAAPTPPTERAGAADPGRLTRAERLACLIAQRHPEPVTVADLAREAGLHPNYAMNLFQQTFGQTIHQFLVSHRLNRAQMLLATTDESILGVALSSGFGSLSRFNAVFRQACGCPPREFRQRHRAPRGRVPPAGGARR